MQLRRAYPPGTGQQQRADRLVRNEAEVRRVLGEAIRDGTVATMRLGASITLSRPILLAGVSYDVVVEGGGRFGFVAGDDFQGTELFELDGNVSDILFSNCSFVGPTSKLERLIASGAGNDLDRVSFDGCTLRYIKRIVQATSGTTIVTNSRFEDLRMADLELTDTTDIGSATYKQCLFLRCYAYLPSSTVRRIAISDGASSVRLVAIDAGPPASTSAISLQDFATSSLDTLSVRSTVTVGEALRFTMPAGGTVVLAGADPILNIDDNPQTVINYTFDATTTGNASISAPFTTAPAKLLVLRCIDNLGAAVWQDTASVRLAGNFTPTTSDTLTLIWDGAVWLELCRSVN